MAEPVERVILEGETPPTQKTKIDFLEHFPIKQDLPARKILFMGDESIGKTSFIQKYCEHAHDYYKCQGYNGPFLVFTQFLLFHGKDDKRILIRLMDLPAATTEESRKDQYPDKVDSIVLCFAVDSPTSLANVWKIWIPEFRKYYPDFDRFYLLGLRNDTREEMLNANKIPVTLERGDQIHQKYKFYGEYMECSLEENPQQAFDLMNRLISDVLHCQPSPVGI